MIQLFDAFAAGVYLLFGVIQIDLWLKRRDRAAHLWLAIASAGALMVDLTGMRLRVLTGQEVLLLWVLNCLGVALVTISLYELVLSLGNERSGPGMRTILAGILALALITPSVGRQFFAFFFLACAVMLLLSMAHAVRAGHAGDREARAIAAGLVVLILTLIVDILAATAVIPLIPGLPIVGFMTLFLVAGMALNTRYEREHGELVALRHDLEQRVHDRTRELEEANQQLAEASRTDSLTGLPNRRGFLELSDHEVKRSARAGAPLSVVMMDLDRFKEINDRHGHAGGDDLLQAAAKRLRSVTRAQDLVARWGGEEFILLLPDTDSEAAAVAAEKVRAALGAYEFERNGTREAITASFGVAAHDPARALEATIAAADEALYRAKEAGRNRVAF